MQEIICKIRTKSYFVPNQVKDNFQNISIAGKKFHVLRGKKPNKKTPQKTPTKQPQKPKTFYSESKLPLHYSEECQSRNQ